MAAANELEQSLKNLAVSPESSRSALPAKKKQHVAESWENEDSGDDTDRPLASSQPTNVPTAPPPTPSSPTSFSFRDQETFNNPFGYSFGGAQDQGAKRATPRPQKTDAVARRLIAGALGAKTPKSTDESRAFERAVREKEIRRREQEKALAVRAKEDAERAKAAVWSE